MRHVYGRSVSDAPMTFITEARLIGLVRALSFARSLSDITSTVTQAARSMVGADGVTFVLRDGDRCYYADEDAIGPLWKGQRFPAKACISGWCMMHRETVVLEDIYDDARIPADAYRPTFVRSLAMVPVRPENPIAAIGAYWRTEHRASEAELAILQAVADATSLAISNVELSLTQERLAAEKEQVERAAAAKVRSLAAASHDLRQPLQAAQLFLETLRRQLKDPRDLKVLELAGLALQGGDNLAMKLLELARLDAGEFRPHFSNFALGGLIAQIAAEARVRADIEGTTLRAVGTSAVVRSDPDLVARIVRNLVSNALKFARGRRVLIGCRRTAGFARVEVWDAGIGIADDKLGQIFDEFYRTGEARDSGAPGLGIGLAVVRKLATLVGSNVTVRSVVGKGSVFAFDLPLARSGRNPLPPGPLPLAE